VRDCLPPEAIENSSKVSSDVGHSAAEKRLRLVDTKSSSPSPKSANEIIKQLQILAKGHNANYNGIISLKHTKPATDDAGEHVPENGGTCEFFGLSPQ
jgi:hypothetical protein